MDGKTGIIVCADDFGLSSGINRGIIEAAAAGRLGAVSCLSSGRHFAGQTQQLRCLPRPPALGLHLCLTGGLSPLSMCPAELAPDGKLPGYAKVWAKNITQKLPVREIERELLAQLAAFERETGAPPAFIDGHMHVHCLGQVRKIALRLARECGAWIRTTWESPARIIRRGASVPKALALAFSGRALAADADRTGTEHNSCFTGAYGLGASADYGRLVERFLYDAQDETLLVCHPGYAGQGEKPSYDRHPLARENELRFLMSDAFWHILTENGLEIVRGPGRRK